MLLLLLLYCVFSLKLDTLSKEDLIKFAKKQMAAMQMIKSKCAGKIIIVAA